MPWLPQVCDATASHCGEGFEHHDSVGCGNGSGFTLGLLQMRQVFSSLPRQARFLIIA